MASHVAWQGPLAWAADRSTGPQGGGAETCRLSCKIGKGESVRQECQVSYQAVRSLCGACSLGF